MSNSLKKNTSAKSRGYKPVVDRKFLLELADSIYNPKTRKFLRLCDGTLQNGPDPTDKKRVMHCGLGELYFAMTNTQPEVTDVSEDDVIDLAITRSPFRNEDTKSAAKAAIKTLKAQHNVKEMLLAAVENIDNEDFVTSAEDKFRGILDTIPDANDDGCGNSCDDKSFKNRSRNVAAKLRKAASLLP